MLIGGRASKNVVGLASGQRPDDLISGNNGNGVTLTKRTRNNRVTKSYIGLSMTRQALPNSGLAILDNGTGNVFDGVVVKTLANSKRSLFRTQDRPDPVS